MDAFIEFTHRFWTDMWGRTEGPLLFRLFLQPCMALLTALIDGRKDARTGRTPYAWTLLHSDRAGRQAAWQEGVTATARILLLGVAMDVIYQFKVFGGFKYPLETFVISILLALVPYVLLRGPFQRLFRWLNARSGR